MPSADEFLSSDSGISADDFLGSSVRRKKLPEIVQASEGDAFAAIDDLLDKLPRSLTLEGIKDQLTPGPALRSALSPILNIPKNMIGEAIEGKRLIRKGLDRPASNALDYVLKGQDIAVGGLRTAFPSIGGLSRSLAGDPVRHVTGSETAGTVAEAALPLGVFGISRVPLLYNEIGRGSPMSQLVASMVGADAPVIPSVANSPTYFKKAPKIPQPPKGVPPASSPKGAPQKWERPSFVIIDMPAGGGKKAISFDELVGENEIKLGTAMRDRLADLSDQKFGFLITRGERSGSRRRQTFESAVESLPFGSFQAERESNLRRLNTIVSSRVGQPRPELTPEWASEVPAGLSRDFQRLAEATGPIATKQFVESSEKLLPGKIRRADRAQMESVLRTIREEYPEQITAQQYQEISSELSTISRNLAATDRDMSRRYALMREELDNAMESSSGSPAMRAEWRDTRRKWKDWLVIESSLDRGTGLIDPSKFAQGVERQRKGQFKTVPLGEDDMVDLATILRTFKNQIPTSGTAERSAAIEGLRRYATGAAAVGLGDITGGLLSGVLGKGFRKYSFSKPKVKRSAGQSR